MNFLILFEIGVILADYVRDLYSNILENYNSLSPPVTGSLDLDRRTIIDVGVDLIWINEIDPAATRYDALIFWELTWHDDRLTWEGIYFKLEQPGPIIPGWPKILAQRTKIPNERTKIFSMQVS